MKQKLLHNLKNLTLFLKKFFGKPFWRFLYKSCDPVILVFGCIEVKKDFLIACNFNQAFHHRLIAGIRSTCCTASLLTGYLAQNIPYPKFAAKCRLCCRLAVAGYTLTGGDAKLAYVIVAISNSPSL